MVLIFGGAYQGKLEYALAHYGNLSIYQCSGSSPSADLSNDIVNSFHLLILAQIRAGVDTIPFIENNLQAFSSKIIISDDISCGIVPLSQETRHWRETTGRSLAFISRHADEVIRVFCGIGTRIK